MPKKNDEILAEGVDMTLDPEEYVTFTAPPAQSEWDDDLFLSVNGDNVRVKRGETVKIKRKFAEVWENSQAQKQAAMETKRRAKDLAGKPIYL